MITYVDTSTLLMLVIGEAGSDRVGIIWSSDETLASAALIAIEASPVGGAAGGETSPGGAVGGCASAPAGTRPRTIVPRNGELSISSHPPTSAMRSCISSIPSPAGWPSGSNPTPSSTTAKWIPNAVAAISSSTTCWPMGRLRVGDLARLEHFGAAMVERHDRTHDR